MTKIDISTFCVSCKSTIRQTIACIDKNLKGIALIVDKGKHLIGTITDGDIRRAWLADQNLDVAISDLLARKKKEDLCGAPITATTGTSRKDLLRVMKKFSVRHIPILDDQNRVVDLVTEADLLPRRDLPLRTIIMAGGYGKRLRPLTKNTPKPMLTVGKEPMLGLIIKQLRRSGVKNVCISTHFKGGRIKKYFGKGKNFDVDIHYVNEAKPLGTAGALGLMPASKEPLLIVNGDVLTKVNYRAMLEFHKENKADMTVAVQKYGVEIAYGVVETDGYAIKGLQEKPRYEYFINAGIYLLEPAVQAMIPKNKHFNMTDLMQRLITESRRIISFPIREYWLDIGNPADYKKAQNDFKQKGLNL